MKQHVRNYAFIGVALMLSGPVAFEAGDEAKEAGPEVHVAAFF